jgi:putative membrane protein
MIVYESNKNWFKDITHFSRSWTMRKIMYAVLWAGVYTTAICVLFLQIFPQRIIMGGEIFSLIGVVLSILLVFRTNTAYERWWEGRRLWGQLVNTSRSLAAMGQAYLPLEDKSIRHYLAVHIANFAIVLKEHLRKGVKYEELLSVKDEEVEVYKTKNNLPSYIAYQIHQVLQEAHRRKDITGEEFLNVKPELQSFYEVLGACERIKKTPIPFSYNVYLKVFISTYLLLLPFTLLNIFAYYTIPVVMLVYFAFMGIEMMGEEIEDPFGLDCNDLPTGDIAHTIKNNVFELLDVRTIQTEREEDLYEKIF